MNAPDEDKPLSDSTARPSNSHPLATPARAVVTIGNEAKFQAQWKAEIEKLERWLDQAQSSNTPEYRKTVERKQSLERELELSKVRTILTNVSGALTTAGPAQWRALIERIERFLGRPNCDPSTLHALKLIEARQRLETRISEMEGAQRIRESTAHRPIDVAEGSVIDPRAVPDPTNSPSKKTAVGLTDRERKILGVIQRGSKGMAYCREVDNAGVRPPRKGVWENGPATYRGAYKEGRSWRHRIQDEKFKIHRKAQLTGVAKLASE
jgi:hypothetical protein